MNKATPEQFTAEELNLIQQLIQIAWQSGAIKSPDAGAEVERLRQKCAK